MVNNLFKSMPLRMKLVLQKRAKNWILGDFEGGKLTTGCCTKSRSVGSAFGYSYSNS
jgi:hypothetical protein